MIAWDGVEQHQSVAAHLERVLFLPQLFFQPRAIGKQLFLERGLRPRQQRVVWVQAFGRIPSHCSFSSIRYCYSCCSCRWQRLWHVLALVRAHRVALLCCHAVGSSVSKASVTACRLFGAFDSQVLR